MRRQHGVRRAREADDRPAAARCSNTSSAATMRPAAHGVDQRRLVDERRARRVDEDRAALHRARDRRRGSRRACAATARDAGSRRRTARAARPLSTRVRAGRRRALVGEVLAPRERPSCRARCRSRHRAPMRPRPTSPSVLPERTKPRRRVELETAGAHRCVALRESAARAESIRPSAISAVDFARRGRRPCSRR